MKSYNNFFQFIQDQFQKIAMTLVLCLAIQVVHAGSYTWNGSQSTTWSASANWTPNGVPSTNDTVTISNGNVSSILLDGNRTITRLVISANTIDLNTYELHVSGRSSLNGGSITNGNLKIRGTYAFFQGTNFYCGMDVISGQLKFSGGIFDQGGNFEQTGTASGFGDGGCTFNGNVTLKNSGATILRMGQLNDDIFNADVTYTCTGTSALQPAYSDSTFYNGNVYLNNTGSGGIVFCNGTSGVGVLANGKTIGVGTTGLTAGVNTLKNILQNGSTAQSITATSTLNITACTFNGSTTITAAGILVKGSTFNSTAAFTKTGNANNYWDGANVFNGTTTINNNTTGNGVLRMALQSGDVYAGDVNFNTSTGPLQVAFSGNSEFRGNVIINHSKVVFNVGSGTVLCTGSAAQQWSGSADFTIGKLTLNKSANGITLQRAATIDSSLTLTSGIIYTDSINLVTLKAGSTCSGGSSLSYVNGPLVRYGASSFIYPLGSDFKFRPISVSASNLSTDALKIQFLNSTPQNYSACDTSIRLGSCENWKVIYISNSKSRIFTISWDSLSCGVPRNNDIIVAGWNGATWKNLGRSSISGGYLSGNVTSSDSSVSSFISLGTLKNNLTIDSVQLGELLNYSLYARDSILMNEPVYSIGKVGSNFINHTVTATDSVLTNFSGSTIYASNSLIDLLGTLNSLSRIQLDTSQFYNGTLTNGVYEVLSDLNIDREVVLDSTKKYVIFLKGNLVLGDSCVFSTITNKTKNLIFVTDTLFGEANSFINATVISPNSLVQIGEMHNSRLSMFSFDDLVLDNDTSDFNKSATYNHPNYNTELKGCNNIPQGCNNLVLNPGFNQCNFLPGILAGVGNGSTCNWNQPTLGTPDYFHQLDVNWLSPPIINIWGPNWPNSIQVDNGIYGGGVQSYVGIIPFTQGFPDYREYAQGTLTNPLNAGQNYYGEFYTNLWDLSGWSTNRMGMYISQAFANPNNATVLPFAPQIENTPAINLTDRIGWTLINGCFDADGLEDRVTIGSFSDDAATNVVPLAGPVFPWIGQPYYFIDDVSIVPIEVSAGTDVTVACTGSTLIGGTNCLEDLNPGQFTYTWSLVSGNGAHGSLSSISGQLPTFTGSNSTTTTQTQIWQVQITTPGGCTAIDQITITVESCCSPLNINLNPSGALCINQSLTLDCSVLSGVPPYTYQWASSSSTSNQIIVSNPGTYTVTVTDDDGCTGVASITITSAATPDIPIITGSTTACNSPEVYTISNPGLGLMYSWSSILPPGGSPSTFPCNQNNIGLNPTFGTSINATFPIPDCNYLIQVVATDPGTGCFSTSTFPINWCCNFNDFTTGSGTFTFINTSISANPGTENLLSSVNAPIDIHIVGTLDIDVATAWIGADVIMYPGAEIIVRPGVTFTLRQNNFSACESFWKSITIMNNATLILRTCSISGAQYGVDVQNGGAYLITDDNVLLDCYTGIRVSGASAGTGLIRIMDRTTIARANSTFYDVIFDYNGQTPATAAPNLPCIERPLAGIELIDAGVINVGRTGFGGKMSISGAEFGIRSVHSSPTVTKVDIDNIQINPCNVPTDPSGSGINAEGRQVDYLTITNNSIAGDDVVINNCRRGVRTSNLGLFIQNAIIQNVQDGIRMINPPSSIFSLSMILNNNICYTNQGIRMFSQQNNYNAWIFGNQINECNNSIAVSPFTFNGGILLNAISSNGTNTIVTGNTLTLPFKKRGISLEGLSASQVIDNNIYLNNSNYSQQGLHFLGVSDLQCLQNNVFGASGVIPNGRVGLFANNNATQFNPFVNYICNKLENTDRGVFFRNHISNSNIDRTEVNNANDGWFVDNSLLGIQANMFNRWCGTFNNAAYNSTVNSSISLVTPSNGPGNGCEYNPFNISITGAGIIQIFPSNITNDPGCSMIQRTDTIDLTSHDLYIIDSLENNNFSESFKWQLRRNLMQKLSRNQPLLIGNQNATDFWNQYSEGEIGQLALYKNRFDSLMYSSNSDIELSIEKKQTLLDIKTSIIWLDSILETRPELEDSILFLIERDSLNQEFDFISFESDSLWKSGWQQVMEEVNVLEAELYNLNITTEWGGKEQQYYSVGLMLGPWNLENNISSADSSIIIELAHLCEREYGYPVTWARAVYTTWFDQEIDEEESCGSGLRVLTDRDPKPNSLLIIKPNPAASQINVKLLSYDADSNYLLRIFGINGNFVNTINLSSADSYLNINYLQNGVYIAELFRDNNAVQRVKLTIVR